MSDRAFKFTTGAGGGDTFAPDAADNLAGTRTFVVWKGSRVGATITQARVVDGLLELTIDPDGPTAVDGAEDARKNPCLRKLQFETKQDALDELARVIKRSMDGERVRGRHIESGVHECPRCGKWHLSSRPWDGNIVNERRTQ